MLVRLRLQPGDWAPWSLRGVRKGSNSLECPPVTTETGLSSSAPTSIGEHLGTSGMHRCVGRAPTGMGKVGAQGAWVGETGSAG